MLEVLASAWFVIIAFCIIMYVLLDGFDLGIGILFLFFKKSKDRNLMVSTVLPVWDGNQTWLVLGGASLYGAFPLAFSLLLPTLYLPIFLMVISLLLRGITFEFRLKEKNSPLWDNLFFLSSFIITICQGLILGTFVKGFDTTSTPDSLNAQLLTPFNLTCSIALLFGYSLLASTWIIGKTEGPLQEKMFKVTEICLGAVIFFMLTISIWTPFISPFIQNIWFNPHYFYKLSVLPMTTALVMGYFIYAVRKRYEYILFWLAIAVFICGYIGFGISTFPYIIPHALTFIDAAAPPSSLLFMLFGALLLIPMLLAYTSYSYYIFRGKINEEISY